MNYNYVVYDKNDLRKVGEVTTNHSISFDDALDLLGAERLEMVHIDDPDLIINGEKFWSDDLDIVLENYYNFRVKWNALLDKCVVPNASGRMCFSLAMLDDNDIRWMVDECPGYNWLLDVTDDGGNNLYEIARDKGLL